MFHKNNNVFLTVVSLTAIAVMVAGVAFAQDNVAITLHNLSVSSGGDDQGLPLQDYGEICVYCHTPHGGDISAPLWNRSFSVASYQMYTSPTIDMTFDAQPTGVSLACLSCHDGTIGLDVITNPPNTFTGTVPGTTPGTNTMPAGFALLGTDLRNDHPISVTYDNALDPMFNSKASVTSAGLRLFGDGTTDKVQCASCHNPHDNTNEPFLRISNASSALCNTCHIK